MKLLCMILAGALFVCGAHNALAQSFNDTQAEQEQNEGILSEAQPETPALPEVGLSPEVEPAAAAEAQKPAKKIEEEISEQNNGYKVGIDDVLDISILQPEKLANTVTVAPDGSINFPYVGNLQVKGLTLLEVQELVQEKLADGYMKYPVVAVALRENRSKKFFVYGEIMKPGTYLLDENTTVLKAISMAGGFTKYGSSSRVKVLRAKEQESGYETLKVNVSAVMNGDAKADIPLKSGDIVVVSEGMF